MSTSVTARTVAVLAATGALLLAVFAVAPQADAATIYACVKKSGGAVRIVSKSAKCKKSESKLVWSTGGPAGKNGANGANGATGAAGKEGLAGKNGANGAVAGYSAAQQGTVELGSGGKMILSKRLPAGSYLVSAKVDVRAESGTNGHFLAVYCGIWEENAGTELEVLLDEAEWAGGLGEYASGAFGGSSALQTQAAITLSASAEVNVWCGESANLTGAKVDVFDTKISAVQTSSNS